MKKEKFKFIGDDYLHLRDTLNKLERSESIILNMNQRGLFYSERELTYMIGGDKELIRQAEFMMGVNRVIKTDPEKYKKILSGNDPRYPARRSIQIVFSGKQQDILTPAKEKIPNYLQ